MSDESTRETVVLFPLDRQIVEAVMLKNGVKFAPAVRIIIREFGRINGLPENTSTIRVRVRKARKPAKRLGGIPGVTMVR